MSFEPALHLEGGREGAFSTQNASKSAYRQGWSSLIRRAQSNVSRSAVESDEAARDEAQPLSKGPFTALKGRLPSRQRMLPLKPARYDLRLLYQQEF